MNIEKLITKKLVRKSLYEFVKEFWDTCDAAPFIGGELVEYLCEAFTWSVRNWLPESVTQHFISDSDFNAIIEKEKSLSLNVYNFREKNVNNHNFNMPPGHTKSMILNVLGPTWVFAHTGVRIASISHTAPLAASMNRKRQAVIKSNKWKDYFPDIKLIKDQGESLIGNHFGELYSINMGAFTGYSAEIIINDDIVSSEQARKDKAALANAIAYYRDTMPSRIRDQKRGVIWNVQQRLAPKDVSGYIQSDPELSSVYTNTIIKAITEEDTTYVFPVTGKVWKLKKGDPLWPERFGNYETLRITQGKDVFETQYQQNPLASDSTYIKAEDIKYMNIIEAGHILDDPDYIFASHDFPVKDKETSDYLGSILGYVKDNKLLITQMMKKRMSFVKSREYVINLSQAYPGIIQIIEDKANGSPILQELQGQISGLIAYEPGSRSKAQRLESASVRFDTGSVYLLTNEVGELENGLEELRDNLISFPFVTHDDDIDAFSQLVNYVFMERRFGVFDKAIDRYNILDPKDISLYKRRRTDVAIIREGTHYKMLKVHYDIQSDTFIIIEDLTFRDSADVALEKLKEFAADSNIVVDATKDNVLYNSFLLQFSRIIPNTDSRSLMSQLSQIQSGLSMKRIKFGKNSIEFRQDLDTIALDKKALERGVEKLEGNEGLVACLRVLIYMYKGTSDFW